jgi:hypothetical protein
LAAYYCFDIFNGITVLLFLGKAANTRSAAVLFRATQRNSLGSVQFND